MRLAALTVLTAALAARAPAADRAVAVTFDDLPGPPGALVANDVAALRENTVALLAAFRQAGVPVVGFVNEGKLCLPGEGPAETAGRRDVLRLWLDAGQELGNHTYSHRSLNRLALDEFEQDVVRGEPVTRALLAEKGRTLRFFRRPFLQVGLDLDKRRAFEAFLTGRGYTVAPVTIDNDEYVYAFAYAITLEAALADAAYRHPDTYVGAWGISWLHHWEITEGRKRSPSPDPPDWVTRAYEAGAR